MPLAFCIFHKEQNHMVKRILQYFRRETVLSAALVCALLSFLLTPLSVIHLQGIDTTTLLMLFSLMTIVAGFRRMGALDAVSRKLTRRVTTLRGLSAVMVALCFALSMLVTNDVALLTLVPLTLLLFRAGGQKSTIWTVVLETVAANLGSMVTPIGNPQNLYLYTSGRLTALDFLTLLAPYAAVALALLLALCLLLPKERVAVDASARAPLAGKMLTLYGALSALALLAIAKVLPAWALAAAVFLGTLALDRGTIRQVDYTLLATFVCFFVFVASVKACVPVRAWLEAMMARSPMAVALLTSQVISNVPACLLLSPFTQNAKALALGVDLGGLGTLIASLASLISFRLYGAVEGAQKAEDGGNAGDSNDEESHRAVADATAENDPWSVSQQAAVAPSQLDDDPWAVPAQQVQPQSVIASGVNDVKAPEQHTKHVAVPDTSDNVDPWAAPAPVPQQPPEDDDPWGAPMPVQAGPADPMPVPAEPETAPKHANHQHRAPRQEAASPHNQPNADPWNQQFSAPAQPTPQVAAEDDEYSMSDESIGASNALSVDDLTRLFEVKKVEDFGPDDAKNPRNMQQKKNLDD
mgnify:CR=1 FL=1